MQAELVWSPLARKDLLEIYLAIGLDNADAAERLYTVMESKAALLIDHPPSWGSPPGDPTLHTHSGRRGVPDPL